MLASEFDLSLIFDDHDFQNHLAAKINDLIQNDFPRLVQILYRMDISEEKLMEILNEFRDADTGLIIGRLLIEREDQKIISRKQLRKNDDIPEDEKW